MLPPDWGDGYPNVWLGVTAEDQEHANERLDILETLPAMTRFASYEPALELVDFSRWLEIAKLVDTNETVRSGWRPPIDWIIIGGESGGKARRFDPAWALMVIEQCKTAGIAVFMKQMGEPWAKVNRASQRHGANPSEWPPEFRVQE